MPAEAASNSDETTPDSSATIDPLALLTELLGRMAADPEADAEASAYAQRALERARAEREAALRSVSELGAGRSDAEEPEGVAQAMARYAPRSASSLPCQVMCVTPQYAVLSGSSRRSRLRCRACRRRCGVLRLAPCACAEGAHRR